MEEAKTRPKVLLLRAPAASWPSEGAACPWSRLARLLSGFTDLEEREAKDPSLDEIRLFSENYRHIFLDSRIAPWVGLAGSPVQQLSLVQADTENWADPTIRAEKAPALLHHSCLLLAPFTAPDLLRILHLLLFPKRKAGVAPLLEKGSLILAEKVLDPNSVGSLLDRLGAYADRLEPFSLKERLPDLRQVLSALLTEGLRSSREAGTSYPFVDFQVSVCDRKIAVNIRFPRGNFSPESLANGILNGTNLFWHQIWQCSDLTFLTHHAKPDELEATVLLTRPELSANCVLRSLVMKSSSRSSREENLLEPPESFAFRILSEISLSASNAQMEEEETPEVPEEIRQRLASLEEKNALLHSHLKRKDEQLREMGYKLREEGKELGEKRAELLRGAQGQDARMDSMSRKVEELEALLERSQETIERLRASRPSSSPQGLVNKMEVALRAAENEKTQLRESIAHEQKKVATLEQKHSSLYREIAAKDREINDLKIVLHRTRKDQTQQPARLQIADEAKEKLATQLKESEEREASYKQELKKLSFRIESHEKNTKGLQADASEKQKLLEQKLKAAKSKEVELMNRIEELVAHLKKASKAA